MKASPKGTLGGASTAAALRLARLQVEAARDRARAAKRTARQAKARFKSARKAAKQARKAAKRAKTELAAARQVLHDAKATALSRATASLTPVRRPSARTRTKSPSRSAPGRGAKPRRKVPRPRMRITPRVAPPADSAFETSGDAHPPTRIEIPDDASPLQHTHPDAVQKDSDPPSALPPA